MDIVDPRVEGYMRSLLDRYDDPVLLEMEAEAEREGFPIVGRLCGVLVELAARSVGARRVFELGSGFGYSAYWFGRAVGPGGEVHCTDRDPENARKAEAYLGRAGVWPVIRFHVADALEAFEATEGAFDVVFSDIDKTAYPTAWRLASERIRVGGLYVCDNTIGYGGGTVLDDGEGPEAIREHDRLVAEDERYVSTIVPTREGVLLALRVR